MRAPSGRTEAIVDGQDLIAHIFDFSIPGDVVFPTPPYASLQCGFGCNKQRREVPAHLHKMVSRTIPNTSEFLLILAGSMEVTFLNQKGGVLDQICFQAEQGFLQHAGGHRIIFSQDSRYLELKQGPYLGPEADKKLF